MQPTGPAYAPHSLATSWDKGRLYFGSDDNVLYVISVRRSRFYKSPTHFYFSLLSRVSCPSSPLGCRMGSNESPTVLRHILGAAEEAKNRQRDRHRRCQNRSW